MSESPVTLKINVETRQAVRQLDRTRRDIGHIFNVPPWLMGDGVERTITTRVRWRAERIARWLRGKR